MDMDYKTVDDNSNTFGNIIGKMYEIWKIK